MDLTTVADDEAVLHDGTTVIRLEGLEPDTDYTEHGHSFRTLRRPAGERLATVATVNDLHIGETECGRYAGVDLGPVLQSEPGEDPYPETMSRAVVAEIAAVAPDAVVAKGDLTARGTATEVATFMGHFAAAFGDRLHCLNGNHEVAGPSPAGLDAPPVAEVVLPGVRLALLDTSVPGHAAGTLNDDQLGWLDELGSRADRPVLVFGHHHPWNPGSPSRPASYFGIEPSASERLVEVVARRPALAGYFAGHTHRNRVRRFASTGDVPWTEVSAVKDYPGGWAEYRVYEGGVLQVFRRASTPDALAWTERTRALFGGLYPGYSFGSLGDRCFAITFAP